jgi:hypothetical protein
MVSGVFDFVFGVIIDGNDDDDDNDDDDMKDHIFILQRCM